MPDPGNLDETVSGVRDGDAEPSAAEDFYDDEYDEDSDEDFLDFICGMMPDGQCSLAGTEDCDWDCPRGR